MWHFEVTSAESASNEVMMDWRQINVSKRLGCPSKFCMIYLIIDVSFDSIEVKCVSKYIGPLKRIEQLAKVIE